MRRIGESALRPQAGSRRSSIQWCLGVNQERRDRAKAILRSALARKPEERSQFVAEACRDDPTLLPEVEALLQSYEKLRVRIDHESDAALGKTIGKYEVLERVGQGAMGVVYKARDPIMRRIVAIKTMSAEIASDPELHDRFYREAQSAGNLSHRNIITIYDMGEADGRPYIAMEFLSGEDLKTKLDRRAKLSLEDRLSWMRETMAGLAHAHGKDVIHRDIKPANIFITREAEPKILDFGLARLTSSVATKSGLVMGTPSYMSPEQVRGEKLDTRSDIFSAGATFYELLAFRKPFPGDSIHGVFFKILETAPDPIPGIPADLAEIVFKMMAKNREARYASATAVHEDLERLEASLPERKRALRAEALEALGRVETLVKKYRESLDREAAAQALAEGVTVSLPIPSALPGEDPDEAATLNELLPSDYLSLVETLAQAQEDARRLEASIRNLDAARSLMAESSVLEAKGDIGGALAKADEALRLVPAHPSAAACVDRLSPRFAERDPRWKSARIEQLLRDGEARLKEGSLRGASERADRIFALEAESPRGRELRSKVDAAIERERKKREAHERAARLVSAARTKLAQEDDPESCLSLLSQALELDPDDSDAQALKEKAENRLAHLKSLAVEETAVEAIAAATLAMRKGQLDLAAREIARAMRDSPDATELPALTLLLERAKGTSVPAEGTEIATQRKKPSPAEEVEQPEKPARRPPPAPRELEPARRPSALPWILGVAASAVLAAAGVLAWRATAPRQIESRNDLPQTSSIPATTTEGPLTTSIATTTVVQPTTTVAPPTTTVPASTSTSTTPRSTVSSTIPPSTSTSSAAPSTTTSAALTTSVVAAPPVRPEDQIAELMRRYEQAYESLDVNALGAIYPAVPLAVKNSFQNFKSLELSMETLSGPEVSRTTAGPTATAVYRIVQRVEPKVGKTNVSRHRATFLFAGVGTSWIIVRVDFQQE
jgi:serine/threonine-protein kinase